MRRQNQQIPNSTKSAKFSSKPHIVQGMGRHGFLWLEHNKINTAFSQKLKHTRKKDNNIISTYIHKLHSVVQESSQIRA